MDNQRKIDVIKKEIGERIRQVRTDRGQTGGQVAERANYDKGNLSSIEQGKANPELNTLLTIIVDGLNMDWSEFCRYWVKDEPKRLEEERVARNLLEQLLCEGRATRLKVIAFLRSVTGAGAESERK